MKRDQQIKIFTDIPILNGKLKGQVHEIKGWNFSACIDERKNLYVWGALVSNTSDSKPSALCIKQPEQVSNLKVSTIEIGQSLAMALEHKTKTAYVIGTNQLGELGLSKEDEENQTAVIDKESRKTFVEQEALKEKPVELIGVGKAGYVLAIGRIVMNNAIEMESENGSVENMQA